MKIKALFLTALLLACSSVGFAQAVGTVKRIGVFTNMKFSQEHQAGYSVELWQENGRFFGFFLSAAGLVGDTPTGLLEDVTFDPKTGKLNFRARLSTGMTMNKNNEEVPSRDTYQFRGSLKAQQLTGVLTHTSGLDPSAKGERKNVSLKKSKSETSSMSKAKSYDEWKKEADEILNLRGPKW